MNDMMKINKEIVVVNNNMRSNFGWLCCMIMLLFPFVSHAQVTATCQYKCSGISSVEDCGSGEYKFSFTQGTWGPGRTNVKVGGTNVYDLGYSAGAACGYRDCCERSAESDNNGNGSTRVWYVKVQTGSTNIDFLSSDFTCIASTAPTVTTTTASSITGTTASSGGNVTDDGGATVTDYGVVWGTSANPTTSDNITDDGSGTGSFVSSLTSLSPNTTYYYRAYAINEAGTSYGAESSFTTSVIVPTVTTTAISSIACTTASSGGNVTDAGGGTVTDYGVCWSTSSSPTTSDNLTDDGSGTGAFASSITGVASGTTIYVRAYATNSAGTAYGSEESFTSLSALSAGTVGSAQTICYNATPVSLTNDAAPTGATGAYTYQWQSSSDGSSFSNISDETSTTYSPGALTANTWYRRAETSGTCGTVYTSSIKMTVYSDFSVGSIGSAQTICYNATPATLTNSVSPTGGTGAYTYQWESSSDGSSFSDISSATSATYSPGALTADTWYRRTDTSGSCGSTNTSSIKVTVNAELTPGSIKF